jgi:hypothetical protein
MIHAVQGGIGEQGSDLQFFEGSGDARDLEGGGVKNVF